MRFIILCFLLIIPNISFSSTTEIGVALTNLGIGTYSTTNALSVLGPVAIGSSAFTSATAPTNGLIIEGNVGIGQLLPATRLDILGTMRTTQLTITGVAGTQCLHAISGVVSGTGGDCGSGGGGGGSGVTFTDGIHTVSGTTQLTISGGTIGGTTPNGTLLINSSPGLWQFSPGNVGINTTSNVGIGTISPQFALQVSGTGQFSSSVIVGSGAATVTGDNNGNVGIGSSTPTQRLDVSGTVRMQGFKMPTGATTGDVLTSVDTSGNSIWSVSSSGGSGNVGVGTTNYLPEYISVGTLGPSNVVVVGGNVGIGSPSPEYGLVVAVNGAKFVSIAPPSPDSNFISNVGIGSSSPGGKLDVEGTINPIVFDAVSGTKNVGIGSFNPGAKLDVQGSVRMTGAGHGIVFPDGTSMLTASSGGGGSGTVTSITAGTGLSGGTITTSGTVAIDLTNANMWTGQQIFNTANVGVGSVNPTQALDVKGTVRAINFIGSSAGLTGLPTGTQWETQNTTDVSLAGGNVGIGTTITNTGAALSVMNGNVGIGTWKPVQLLQVMGNVSIGTSIGGASLTVGTTGGLQISSGGNISKIGGSTVAIQANQVTLNNGGGGVTFTGTSENVTVGAGTNSIKFFNAGNMGIGTTLPSQIYEVGKQFLDISSIGNVGIGTIVPNGSLDVEGTVNPAVFFSAIPTSGTSQNVGIGSFMPGQKLDVNGTIRFSSSLINTKSSTGIGWSEHNATNQACNTTCGTSACVIGLDIGTVGVVNSGFVACSDATADDCICAGP